MFKLKRTAFTLAEVLIALGLVGILSAVAIQTMKHNDHAAEFDALKNKSTMNIQASMHDAMYKVRAGEIITEGDPLIDASIDSLKTKVEDALVSKGEKPFPNAYIFDPDPDTVWEFKGMRDGVYFAIDTDKTKLTETSAVARVAIDVNAEAGPNNNGKDQLLLYMDKYGNLGPVPPPKTGCDEPEVWVAACGACKNPADCTSPRSWVREGSSCDCKCPSPRVWTDNDCKCPAPKSEWTGSSCICPDGKHFYNNTCNDCEEGKELSNGHCCPIGQSWNGTKCTDGINECPPGSTPFTLSNGKVICLCYDLKAACDEKVGWEWSVEHSVCLLKKLQAELSDKEIDIINQSVPGLMCGNYTTSEPGRHFSCASSVMSPIFDYLNKNYLKPIEEYYGESPNKGIEYSEWAYQDAFVGGVTRIACSRILSGTFVGGQSETPCSNLNIQSTYEWSSLGFPADDYKPDYYDAIGKYMLKAANDKIDEINNEIKQSQKGWWNSCPAIGEATQCCNPEPEDPCEGPNPPQYCTPEPEDPCEGPNPPQYCNPEPVTCQDCLGKGTLVIWKNGTRTCEMCRWSCDQDGYVWGPRLEDIAKMPCGNCGCQYNEGLGRGPRKGGNGGDQPEDIDPICLERPEAPGCNDWNPGGGYSDDETNPHY